MDLVPLSLLWAKDQDGYSAKLLQRRPDEGKTETILKRHVPKPRGVIERRGGKMIYDLIDLRDKVIWKKLLKLPRSADGAHEFVSEFGFLTHPERKRENASEVYEVMDRLRELNAAADRDDWEALSLWLIDNPKLIRVRLAIERERKTGREMLAYVPDDLRSAIYNQFFRDRTHCVVIKDCARKGCPESFYCGPNRRRESAKYCSDACRMKDFEIRKAKGVAK
jgi:hypothetical protein